MKDNDVSTNIRYIQETLEEIRELKILTFIEILGLKPYNDGKLWHFSYGNDIKQITVSGNTLFEAAVNLYEAIR